MFWKIYFLIGTIVGLFFCVFARKIINNPEKYDAEDDVYSLIVAAINQMGSEVFYLGIFLISTISYPVILIQAIVKVLRG